VRAAVLSLLDETCLHAARTTATTKKYRIFIATLV
jgi:hypothetical protein